MYDVLLRLPNDYQLCEGWAFEKRLLSTCTKAE